MLDPYVGNVVADHRGDQTCNISGTGIVILACGRSRFVGTDDGLCGIGHDTTLDTVGDSR